MGDPIKDGHVKQAWPDSSVNHRIEGAYHPQPAGTSPNSTNVQEIVKQMPKASPGMKGSTKGGMKK